MFNLGKLLESIGDIHRRGYYRTPWTDATTPFSKDLDVLQNRVLNATMHQRKKYNLLLVGRIKAGKSSFVNSLVTATAPWLDSSDNRVKIVAAAGSASDSFTSILKRYSVGPYVVIHDMPGLDNKGNLDNADPLHVIMDIIDGKVPDRDDLRGNNVPDVGNPDWKIDAVVIVIEAKMFNDVDAIRDTGLVPKYRELLKQCRTKGISYTIMLTKVSDCCAETKNNIRDVFYSVNIKKVVEIVEENLGVDRRCVVPVENYSTQHIRKPDIEKLQLHCLDIILTLVEETANQLHVEYRHGAPDAPQ